MPSKSYNFFDRYRLGIGWTGSSASKSIKKDIKWDEKSTVVKSVKLRGRIWAQFQTQARISLNGVELLFADAGWGDNIVEATVDASGSIINGTNECLIELWKIIYTPVEKSGEFSAELIIEYEGSPPEEKPWFEKYLTPIIVIGGASAIIGGAILTRGR